MPETSWMNGLRALAVVGVVIHHWIHYVPYDRGLAISNSLAEMVQGVSGTAVHLFFLLSGCGLTISHIRGKHISWKDWMWNRARKIILPYWLIALCTFGLANLALYRTSGAPEMYSWQSLLAYLTFTRNQYSPSWGLNPTLWFMPVIVGLYVLFPFLVGILRKYGIRALLILACLLSYGSIVLFQFFDYGIEHQSAIFLFFVLEFATGMVLGYLTVFRPETLGGLFGAKGFILGIVLYLLSYQITNHFETGGLYNDPLTAAGVFLITLNIWNVLLQVGGERIAWLLDELSKVSYMMYLIHGGLILYIVIPLLKQAGGLPLNPLMSLVLAGVFVVAVFALARVLYKPVMAISKVAAQSKRAHSKAGF